MKKYSKIILFTLLFLAVAALAVVGLKFREQMGGGVAERTSYEPFGAFSASSTLTSAYSGNRKVYLVTHFDNLHLDISYFTPSSTNQYVNVLVEGSNDDGETFYPMTNLDLDASTNTLALSMKDITGALDGVPFVLPGDRLTVTGTYKGMADMPINFTHVRISAKETGATNFGKIYARATFTSKD